jgi:hypothetical protein
MFQFPKLHLDFTFCILQSPNAKWLVLQKNIHIYIVQSRVYKIEFIEITYVHMPFLHRIT